MKVCDFLLVCVKSLGILCGMVVFAENLMNSMIRMKFCENLRFSSNFREIFGHRMQDDGFRGKLEESHDSHEVLIKFQRLDDSHALNMPTDMPELEL